MTIKRIKNWFSASAWREWGKKKLQNSRIAKRIKQKHARIPKGSESTISVLFSGKPPGFEKTQKPEAVKGTQAIPARTRLPSIAQQAKKRQASMQEAIEEKRRLIEVIEKNSEGRALQETEKKSLQELSRELQESIRMLETRGTEKGKEFIPTLQVLLKKIQRMLLK